jgi:selenocysteine-specific elongation factor
VQVHGKGVPRASAGQRTAVNLPGVEAQAISRGQALVHPGVVPPTSILDVELTLLAGSPRPIRHRSRLLLHVGTAQVPCAVALVDGSAEIAPGGSGFAQLRLAAPVAALPGQRFILRGFRTIEGRGKTVGGGRVLAILPRKRRRGRPENAEQLRILAGGDADLRLLAVLEMAGPAGLSADALVGRTALSPKAVQATLERLGARGQALLFDRDHRAWVAAPVARELQARILQALAAFHAAQPLAAGVGREELRGRLPPVTDPRLFARLLSQLQERSEVAVAGDLVRLPGHAAASGGQGGALKDRVAAILREGALAPPRVVDLAALAGGSAPDVAAVLKLLAAEGTAVRVSPEIWFDGAAVAGLRERLVAHLREHREISTAEFKELVGATRKHVIPLAEYFDRERVTLRVGEKRHLRGDGRVS